MSQTMKASLPWYREPWPWLLMAGPVAVILAGGYTAWLAVTNEDGLVSDDYYKQGLAINKVIRRESAAAALGIQARIAFGEDSHVSVDLSGAAPRELILQLVHPTRAGMDRRVPLTARGSGRYEGILRSAEGRWHVAIEDPAGTWRVGGIGVVDTGSVIRLDARSKSEAGG